VAILTAPIARVRVLVRAGVLVGAGVSVRAGVPEISRNCWDVR